MLNGSRGFRMQEQTREARTILFINHTAALGGGEIALLALAKELMQRSLPHSILLLDEGPLVSELAAVTTTQVLPLSRTLLKTPRTSLFNATVVRSFFRLPIDLMRIALLIRRLKVAAVHTNSLKACLLGGIAGRLAGVDVIWHVRDRIANDYMPARTASLIRILAKLIPSAIITNSHATLDSLELKEQLNSRPITRVVHDGVSLARFSKPAIPHVGIVIGILGRLSPWKGQDVFLKAAAKVHMVHPQVQFQIIGSALFGEEEYADQLIALSTSLGLAGSVIFTGFVTDTVSALQGLDIVVHASTVGEPFGQVIIEGMAASKPVIATAGGGVPEIVSHGVTGILVPMSDVEALAQAMQKLIEDPELRVELGRQGRVEVERAFQIETVADNVLHLYEDLRVATLNN